MIKSLSLPSMPSVQLFRPILLAALGLHALFLFVPFPSEEKKPPENKEAPVKITQLPTTRSTASKPATANLSRVNKPTLPKINRRSTNSPVLRAPTPIASRTQDFTQATAQTTANSAAPSSSNNQSRDAANPFQDFPHFLPSTPNGFDKGENCRIASANLATVASFYQTQPAKKGFTVQLTEESAEVKVFEVAKAGKILYLSLLADGPTTVVLLAEEKVTDLEALKGAQVVPSEYVELLGSVLPESDRADNPGTNAVPEQFQQPEFFYSTVSEAELRSGTVPDPKPGIDGSLKVAPEQSPTTLYQVTLEPELKNIFTDGIAKVGDYGGGSLYQLKKGSTTIYLNLVPVKGGNGTIVVTWLRDPRG